MYYFTDITDVNDVSVVHVCTKNKKNTGATACCPKDVQNKNHVQSNQSEDGPFIHSLFHWIIRPPSTNFSIRKSKGQVFLNVIVNQLSNGGDSNHDAINEWRNKRVVSSRSLFQHLSHLFELIQEIVTTRETSSFTNENDNMDTDEDKLRFIMYGINCLNSILVCIDKSNDSNDEDCNKSVQSMKKSFSNSCHQLLQRQWNADTKKYTKSNVGTLLSLYLEHYPNPYSPVDNFNFNVLNFGRMGALINVIRNVLAEIPNTIKCKGPLPSYPTCCDKTFPFYYFNAFSYLVKEIHSLFHMSSQQQLQLSVGQKQDVLEEQVRLLDSLSLLTKENSHLAKSPILLI